MTYVVGDSFGDSPHKLTTETRHFEQTLRVDRPPSALSFTIQSFLPANQGQRWMDSDITIRNQRVPKLTA
jgi:hypothetical protein